MTHTRISETPRFSPGEGRRDGALLVAAKGVDDVPALRVARLLSLRTGASVQVLSVLPPEAAYLIPADLFPLPPEYERDRGMVRLRGLERQMGEVLGEERVWPAELLFGDAPRVIAEAARARRAKLIIMGIGRHDPTSRLLAGETTVHTIRHAGVPVLAVAGDGARLPATAVAAVDFSPASVHAVEQALELLAPPATLHLVHVWPQIETVHPLLHQRLLEYEHTLPERFARLRQLLAVPAGITVQETATTGTTVEELLAFARATRAELLIAGRQSHPILERLTMGSVTAALLRGSTCSVLVAPEPGVRDVDRIERALTGATEGHTPERWVAQLEAFTKRNAGRRTALELDDPVLGVQSQETGYLFRGASYDRRDGCVQLMLEAPDGRAHLTRSIEDVQSVSALARGGKPTDDVLRIAYGKGQLLLTFLP
ncbi:MAG TPA: universal stress protein [Gemmatimonadaceae bacterium]|nr:universal stress protein [Gemmatimonadaceae bacterium]